MPLKSLSRHPLLLRVTMLTLLTLSTACQLLRPYQYPLTATPEQWKGSYDAPDEGKPSFPLTWKEELALVSHPEVIDDKEPQFSSGPFAEADPEVKQEPFRFEDVCDKLENWWEVFQDPILNQLEEQALESSFTLWAALERVIEARAQARVTKAPLFPQVNFAPSFSRTGSLVENPLTGVGIGGPCGTTTKGMGSSSSSPGLAPIMPINPVITNAANQAVGASLTAIPPDFRFVDTQYLIPFNFSYEVDLWRQLDNAYYASVFRAQASFDDYLSVLLSLTSDVASTYFTLRGLDSQREVIQRNIRVRENAFEINKSRYKAGLIVYVDVSRAEVELATAHSDLDDAIRQRGLQENLLAKLVGVPASVFCLPYQPVFFPPPVIPRGLPSELLCRRPDVAEAERNLAAAYRDIGVAYANFFPSLNLTAALGVESPFPHQLFEWKSRYWQVASSVLQMVFDGGRNQANYDYYKARFQEAMANYQQQVLQAFQDVEDALVNLRWYANQAQDLAIAVKSARTTLELSQMRYSRGIVNYLDVTDAERQLLQTEQTTATVLGNRYVSTVRLIRALGGGWGPCETCAAATPLESSEMFSSAPP